MQRRFVPVQLSDLSTLQYSFSQPEANARSDRTRILCVTFQGVYGYGSAGNSDARFMKAVVHLGCEAFDPKGIVLDFRQLDYQWGDEMAFPIEAAHVDWVRPAILISDLCRQGMTSFVQAELFSNPEIWLFGDIESALRRVEADDALLRAAEDYVFPELNDAPSLESFEDQLRNKYFRKIVAAKYRAYAPLRLPFRFMRSVMLADAQASARAKEPAEVFNTLAQDFLARFELKALDVFLEGLSYGLSPEKIYWLEALPTPLLDLFILEIERRLTTNTTSAVNALQNARQLFSAAKQERATRLTSEVNTL